MTDFALPDLDGRTVIGANIPDVSPFARAAFTVSDGDNVGDVVGADDIFLTSAELPPAVPGAFDMGPFDWGFVAMGASCREGAARFRRSIEQERWIDPPRRLGSCRACYKAVMPLHLIKLAVGADSLADLREWMAERMADAKRRRAPLRHAHVTRMAPKRAEQVLEWRLALLGGQGHDLGQARDRRPRAVRRCGRDWPLQDLARRDRGRGRAAADARLPGLALLSGEDAPPDIDEAQPGFAAMPEGMRRELASLGLL